MNVTMTMFLILMCIYLRALCALAAHENVLWRVALEGSLKGGGEIFRLDTYGYILKM